MQAGGKSGSRKISFDVVKEAHEREGGALMLGVVEILRSYISQSGQIRYTPIDAA